MAAHDRHIEEATRYLRECAGLRSAVGASPQAVLVPEPLGEGEHNVNFRFVEPGSGRAYVLRVNVATQPFHDNQVAYEFAALEALAGSGCTPAPVFLDDTPRALGKGVIVEGFCEGAELDFDRADTTELAQAVRLMANVHAVPVLPGCPLHQPADPLRDLFGECLQRFDVYRASAFEDARITRWVERFISAVQLRLDTSTCRPEDRVHIVNTEPLASHFLLTGDAEAPGSFIDWERPIVGEVAQDVAYFTAPTTTFWDSDWLMPADVAENLVQRYWEVVDGRFPRGDFDERYRLYRAMTALRSATWCCRALVTYSLPGAHKTERTMRKLPIYLSDDFMACIERDCIA